MFHMKKEEKEKQEQRKCLFAFGGRKGEVAEAANFNNKWNNTL